MELNVVDDTDESNEMRQRLRRSKRRAKSESVSNTDASVRIVSLFSRTDLLYFVPLLHLYQNGLTRLASVCVCGPVSCGRSVVFSMNQHFLPSAVGKSLPKMQEDVYQPKTPRSPHEIS